MIKIGQINSLEVIKKADFGVFLDGDDYGSVLLPSKYVPEGTEIGEHVDVFLYFDSESQLAATIFVGHHSDLNVRRVDVDRFVWFGSDDLDSGPICICCHKGHIVGTVFHGGTCCELRNGGCFSNPRRT